MTSDRSDNGVTFVWNDDLRARVERRAGEIRRGRRNVVGLISGLLALVTVGVFAATMRSGPSNQRVATAAPSPASALAQLLPPPSLVTDVLPQLSLKAVSGGLSFGMVTPAELSGVVGGELGVTRQWVSETGSVRLQPGQQYPDEVTTVISAVVQFDSVAAAQGWTRQALARSVMPVHLQVVLPVGNNLPLDVEVLRAQGDLGELKYLAFFTDGNTAFSLQMVAGGTGAHDGEFVRLVHDWVAEVARRPPSTTQPNNASGRDGPAISPPSSRP